MKQIIKTLEPNTLTRYRSSLNKIQKKSRDVYKNFPEKSQEGCTRGESGNLRIQLLEEQGHICCYCMQRISCVNSRIEHYQSQSRHPKKQIVYKNLFVACNNSEGKEQAEQHCDVKKSELDLRQINLLFNIENRIMYTKDGNVYSDNIDLNHEIENIINLNLQILIDARRETLSSVFANVPTWDLTTINKLINKYSQKNSAGMFAPFCQMIVWNLQKKARRYGA